MAVVDNCFYIYGEQKVLIIYSNEYILSHCHVVVCKIRCCVTFLDRQEAFTGTHYYEANIRRLCGSLFFIWKKIHQF